MRPFSLRAAAKSLGRVARSTAVLPSASRGAWEHANPWLSRPLRGSCRKENTPAEQVEAGATVHLRLAQLEPGDLALHLAAAPGRREGRLDRSAVLLQPSRKSLESTDPRRPGVSKPGGQRHT